LSQRMSFLARNSCRRVMSVGAASIAARLANSCRLNSGAALPSDREFDLIAIRNGIVDDGSRELYHAASSIHRGGDSPHAGRHLARRRIRRLGLRTGCGAGFFNIWARFSWSSFALGLAGHRIVGCGTGRSFALSGLGLGRFLGDGFYRIRHDPQHIAQLRNLIRLDLPVLVHIDPRRIAAVEILANTKHYRMGVAHVRAIASAARGCRPNDRSNPTTDRRPNGAIDPGCVESRPMV
jgi:hypothetical protein